MIKTVKESYQPSVVRRYLQQYKPDIIVMTGHDGIKKNNGSLDSLDNYWNSRFFIQAVREARKYEPRNDKLCIYAGACQSYYEGIMAAGANFASSPGRILINCYDPSFVSDKVAITDTTRLVTPQEISKLTFSGSRGIWGVNTKGQMKQV